MAKNPSDKNNCCSQPGWRENLERQQNVVQREKDASFKQSESDLQKLDRAFSRQADTESKSSI
jgi:hypothetical protein